MLRKAIHIVHITVRIDYRNKGVGCSMIQAIIDHFKNKTGDMFVAFFYTEAGWKNFFKKNGFQITGQNFFIKMIEKRNRLIG
jgi:tRNA(Met) C34 N-acetyltransferase TmcA